MRPDVAVIIPTYYRNELLLDALESTRSEANDISEVIVVDGSGEGHAEPTLEQFSISGIDVTYIKQNKDQGVAAARDKGVEVASTDYIRFLDDDDILVPDAIDRLTEAVSDAAGVAYGGIRWEDGQTILPDPDNRGNVLQPSLAFQMAPCFPSTMLVERSLFEEIPKMKNLVSDDIPLKIELAQVTNFATVDTAVAERNGGFGLGDATRVADRRKEILKSYSSLYKKQPEWVWREAKKSVHLRAADSRLSEQGWSPRAILESAKCAYYGRDIMSIGYFISSLFGRRGRDVGKRLYKAAQDSERAGKLS